MNSPLLADLMRESWAMEPRALEGFLQTIAKIDPRVNPTMEPAGAVYLLPDLTAERATVTTGTGAGAADVILAARMDGGPMDEAPRRSRLSIAEGVASIVISGVLLKRVPNLARWWGIECTGYGEIHADLAQAMGDESVKSISLRIESPGGQVSGVKEIADAVHSAADRKDVTASVQDLCASAAYWIASQADTITANPNATVGSLGAYTAYPDYSKAAEMEGIKVHVIASGPHKGMGVPGAPISEEQLQPVRELINAIAGGFAADVARGRGMGRDEISAWMTGRVWRAEEAMELGLIDGIKNSYETSSGGPAAAETETPQCKVETMANDIDKAAAEEKIRSEAAGAERKRLADLNAAFPGEEKFVMEQYAAGATPEKAAVAFVAVQRTRLDAKDKELEAAKTARPAPAGKPVGAAPLPVGGDPAEAAAQGGPTFIEAAEKMVADGRAKNMTQALSKLAKGSFDKSSSAMFDKYLESCEAAAPEHNALKRRMGVK